MNYSEKKLHASLSSPKDLPPDFILSPGERDFFRNQEKNDLNFLTSSYYFSLIDPANIQDPIRKQCIPTEQEHHVLSVESSDPLEEALFSPVPRLIHRYPSRVLIRLTGQCASNCRFCYRRDLLEDEKKVLSAQEFQVMIDYISEHPEINEVLISGGDPLTLPTETLGLFLTTLRSALHHVIIRLCSRIPVVNPHRIDEKLVNTLKEIKGLWLITHYNHPRELTDISREKLQLLREGGVNILNQTVLLKGVNDNEQSLISLFQNLSFLGVKPYYLFQTDLTKGTSHFRVDLKKGIALYENLTQKLSALMLPIYALDLPQGGGKIRLTQKSVVGKENGFYLLKDDKQNIFCYPISEKFI